MEVNTDALESGLLLWALGSPLLWTVSHTHLSHPRARRPAYLSTEACLSLLEGCSTKTLVSLLHGQIQQTI